MWRENLSSMQNHPLLRELFLSWIRSPIKLSLHFFRLLILIPVHHWFLPITSKVKFPLVVFPLCYICCLAFRFVRWIFITLLDLMSRCVRWEKPLHHVLVLLYYCFDRIFPLKVELDKVITYTDRGGAKGAERGQLSALTPQNFSAIY